MFTAVAMLTCFPLGAKFVLEKENNKMKEKDLVLVENGGGR